MNCLNCFVLRLSPQGQPCEAVGYLDGCDLMTAWVAPPEASPSGGAAFVTGYALLTFERFQIVNAAIHRLDICKLCINVKQVPFNSARHAVANTLAHRYGTKPFGQTVTQGRAHTR